jgi:hypothetical protein
MALVVVTGCSPELESCAYPQQQHAVPALVRTGASNHHQQTGAVSTLILPYNFYRFDQEECIKNLLYLG